MIPRFADYEFYSAVFEGVLIPEDEFNRYARQATAYINAETFGQIDEEAAKRTDVKLACCAVAEVLYKNATSEDVTEGGAILQSERVGEHSVSYAVSHVQSKSDQMLEAMQIYLFNLPFFSQAVPYKTGC